MSINDPKPGKYKREPKPCPVCKKIDMVIPVIYGFPGSGLMEDSKNGKVKLGGCVIGESNPSWYCKRDEIEF